MVKKRTVQDSSSKSNSKVDSPSMKSNEVRKKVVLTLHKNYFGALSDNDNNSIETVETVMSIFVKGKKKKKLGSNATKLADKLQTTMVTTKKVGRGMKKSTEGKEEDIDALIAQYQMTNATSTEKTDL